MKLLTNKALNIMQYFLTSYRSYLSYGDLYEQGQIQKGGTQEPSPPDIISPIFIGECT